MNFLNIFVLQGERKTWSLTDRSSQEI